MKSTKRLQREEKKKRKLVALANLVQLNDKDRLQKAAKLAATENMETTATSNESEDSQTYRKDEEAPKQLNDANAQVAAAADDGFTMVYHKKKKRSNNEKSPAIPTEPAEPAEKRLRQEQVCDEGYITAKQHTILTEEQYHQLQRQLRERKRQLENGAVFRLKELGQRALLQVRDDERTPIFLTDIQQFLMSIFFGSKSPCQPQRWCHVERMLGLSHSVVLVVEGLSLYHYSEYESQLPRTNGIFEETKLEMLVPRYESGLLMQELLQASFTNLEMENLIDKYGSLESALEMDKDASLLLNSIYNIEAEIKQPLESTETPPAGLPAGDTFPRTKLLLSALQMVDEGYPLPLRGELSGHFKHYIFTKTKYAPVTDHSPMFGVDCEMCRTVSNRNELTRISIVNERMETVYETLVRPTNRITDYLTQYSGITAEAMLTVTKTLKDVQKEVCQLLPPDAILIGQSLNSDLHAMQMMHPYVIDTSVVFNLTGQRSRKSKLKLLAKHFLEESIQEHVDGHDSVEDSIASLKLVQKKLANGIEFGDVVLAQKRRFNDIIKCAKATAKNAHEQTSNKRDKSTVLITAGKVKQEIKQRIENIESATQTANAKNIRNKSITMYEMNTNKEAVRKLREVALEHALAITNLHVEDQQLLTDTVEETLKDLDAWISKIWQSMAHNSMLLVIFGGSKECNSGVAKIAFKKNAADVAAKVPITL